MNVNFEGIFDKHILKRGYEYFISGKVGDVYLDKDVYSATVQGTQEYHVEITLENDTISNMKCDCPYAKNQECKHMAALLYTIQDNDTQQGKDEKCIKDAPSEEDFTKILLSIPKDELIKFNDTIMKQDINFQNSLKAQFSGYFSSNVDSYLVEWNNIITDAEDRHGFINYHNSFGFESNTINFLHKIEELGKQQPSNCFQICSLIYYDLAEIAIDDSAGCITTLVDIIQGMLKDLLRCGDDTVRSEIRLWLKESIDNPLLQDYCLDEGLDILYVKSTPLPERIDILKNFILHSSNDDYQMHCGEYIEDLIYSYEEVGMNSEQIYDELLKYKEYTPARNWIIKYLLSKDQVDKAINYIKEGVCKDAWDKSTYMKWLISLYKEFGYEKEYDMEMRVYIASDAKDAFLFYERYRKQFTQEEWQEKCEGILRTIHQKDLLAKCFYLEGMVEQLRKLFEEDLSFYYLREYEDLLIDYDSPWVLTQYIKECDTLCREPSNDNYERIHEILEHLKTLPNGEMLAIKKRDELLEVYRRRPNLVKLLKTV